MALIPNQYLNSVVSIGVKNNNNILWIGTGFFVYRRVKEGNKDTGRAIPFLVTNKHVISNFTEIQIRLKRDDTDSLQIVPVPLLYQGQKLYKVHPISNIDIAVIQLNGSYIEQNKLNFIGFDIDENSMNSTSLRENGIDEGSLIYMLGFPMGLVNESSLLPICRLGCIARINEAQINETKSFLADIQNFPGNSGSPIINRVEIISLTGTKNINRTMLIGVVHSYIPYQEELLNTQTNKVVEIRSENSGIALVHPIEFVKEIIDSIYKNEEGENK